ncbi:MAG: HD domain-containing protein [Planctomycetaceae bacterium]|nr:HD domain-containing protein [Planctomycetaceae bacterium]
MAAVAEASPISSPVRENKPDQRAAAQPGSKSGPALGEILAPLTYALDLTEGQPVGHAARSCVVGMRIAEKIGLPAGDRSALYYGLLLKDAGCSSNAAKTAFLFGADDRKIKHDLKAVNWARAAETWNFMRQHVAPESSRVERYLKMAAMMLHGPNGPKRLVKMRCERGAAIARALGFSDAAARVILDLDEHWNGGGYPHGLHGSAISLGGRIAGLAQTFEVFLTKLGPQAALEMIGARRAEWFDPNLVDALRLLAGEESFLAELRSPAPAAAAAKLEPTDTSRVVDDALLDRIADVFAQIVDAKSPYTFRHSRRVAEIAVEMGQAIGYDKSRLRLLRRAGLLHDLGKLGISNLVLDKPGKLTDDETAVMQKHSELSERILSKVAPFAGLAAVAGAHHERLDGRGYHRGIASAELCDEARLLTVADMFEALTAARPYRGGLPVGKVLEMLRAEAGKTICGEALEALQTSLMRNEFESRVARQMEALDRLSDELESPNFAGCAV